MDIALTIVIAIGAAFVAAVLIELLNSYRVRRGWFTASTPSPDKPLATLVKETQENIAAIVKQKAELDNALKAMSELTAGSTTSSDEQEE